MANKLMFLPGSTYLQNHIDMHHFRSIALPLHTIATIAITIEGPTNLSQYVDKLRVCFVSNILYQVVWILQPSKYRHL